MPGTCERARANRPAWWLGGGVLHMCLPVLQIGQVCLDGGTGRASGQPPEVPQHALRSLMFEPMQHAFQPTSRQPASLGLHGLPDLVDVFGSMRKIQDAHGFFLMIRRPPRSTL